MPEGHTLHRLALTLDRAFAGSRVRVSSPQGRFAEGAALLDGLVLERAEAWGKHLFLTFEGERILNVHLGLIGVFDVTQYAVAPASGAIPPPPVGAVRVRLVSEEWFADLRGATVVDLINPEQQATIVARLGPDPLRAGEPGHETTRSLAKLARTDRPVAELLMDQSVLAGVGNVYRSELLWRHRIDPFTPGRKVKKATWQMIWDDLVDLMPIGVAFGQIITLEEQVAEAKQLLAELSGPTAQPTGNTGGAGDAGGAGSEQTAYLVDWQGGREGERARVSRASRVANGSDSTGDGDGDGDGDGQRRPAYEKASPFPRDYAVYKRQGEPCPTCGSRIRTQVLAGRNLFWCGRCQRRH